MKLYFNAAKACHALPLVGLGQGAIYLKHMNVPEHVGISKGKGIHAALNITYRLAPVCTAVLSASSKMTG